MAFQKPHALSRQEEIELFWRIKAGDEHALDFFVRCNLGLPYYVAFRYFIRRNPKLKVYLEELVAAGNEGLLRAINKFDEKRGHRFGTYAIYWIRQFMQRWMKSDISTIRIPDWALDSFSKWERGMSLSERDKRGVQWVQGVRTLVSLDSVVTSEQEDSSETSFLNFLALPAVDPLESAVRAEEAGRFLSLLSEQEKKVIMLRFGLTDGKEWMLKEIGLVLGVTRERVRQIEAKALKKMRSCIS